MTPALPRTFQPSEHAPPYRPDPQSQYRVTLAFRVDFNNGGHVEGKDFLLDIAGNDISASRAANMIVSSMNRRAGDHLLIAGCAQGRTRRRVGNRKCRARARHCSFMQQ